MFSFKKIVAQPTKYFMLKLLKLYQRMQEIHASVCCWLRAGKFNALNARIEHEQRAEILSTCN